MYVAKFIDLESVLCMEGRNPQEHMKISAIPFSLVLQMIPSAMQNSHRGNLSIMSTLPSSYVQIDVKRERLFSGQDLCTQYTAEVEARQVKLSSILLSIHEYF